MLKQYIDEYRLKLRAIQLSKEDSNLIGTPIQGTHSEIVSYNEPEKPMTPDEKNMRLYNHYVDVSASLEFENNEPYFAGGGSDAVIAYRLGIPVLCQTGVRGENHHTLRERAEIQSLVQRAKILTKAITELPEDFI